MQEIDTGVALQVRFITRYCACGRAFVTTKQHVTGRCESCEAAERPLPVIDRGSLATNIEANR